jgi:hypothetical protein
MPQALTISSRLTAGQDTWVVEGRGGGSRLFLVRAGTRGGGGAVEKKRGR